MGFTTGLGQEPRQRDIPARAVVRLEQEILAAERFGLPPEAHGGKRLRRIGIVALARKLLVALWK